MRQSRGHTPALLMLCALTGSVLVSPVPSASLRGVWVPVVGLAVFYASPRLVRSVTDQRGAVVAIVVSSLAVAIGGVAIMQTPPAKLFGLTNLYAALSDWTSGAVLSWVGGVRPSANEIASVLVCCLPLALALAVARGPWRERGLGILGTLLIAVGILLTQSRGALVALASALLIWTAFWKPRAAALVGAFGLVLVVIVGSERVAQFTFDEATTSPAASIGGRYELWTRAASMLLDMPITGIGLNAFPEVLQQFYPLPQLVDPSVIQDADNLYLQIALDVGLPGLVALVLLASQATRSGLAALRSGGQPVLAAGLLVGIGAFAIHGLLQAAGVGSRSALVVWTFLALLNAFGLTAVPASVSPVRAGRQHSRSAAIVRGVIVAASGTALAGPIALNAANVVLHRSDATSFTGGTAFNKTLSLAGLVTWGPFRPRVLVGEAGAARARGNGDLERSALEGAVASGTWDSSLAVRLADLDLSRGDEDAAVAVWRGAGLTDVPLGRAAGLPHETALRWLDLAERVDPSDWRPYAFAATMLKYEQPQRADTLLSEALRLRGLDAARSAIADRLQDPRASLPTNVHAARSAVDSRLFVEASQQLEVRPDLPGAVYAVRLASEADASNSDACARARELQVSGVCAS